MAESSPPAVEPDTRIYAIGDIHGRADLLERLHAVVQKDADGAPEARRLAVYLGDYVDRGDDSKGVLEMVADGLGPDFESVHLKGNHEDFLLRFLDDPGEAGIWLWNGGKATLRSYEIDPDLCGSPDALRDRFAEALPVAHRVFLESLRLSFTNGDYFFVHAGVRPGVALEKQDSDDLMWIREEFLDSAEDFGKTIVYGHTPHDAVTFGNNRIGIDTNAWVSGRLTCLVLTGNEQRVLHI